MIQCDHILTKFHLGHISFNDMKQEIYNIAEAAPIVDKQRTELMKELDRRFAESYDNIYESHKHDNHTSLRCAASITSLFKSIE
jgi:hypothetical protein